MVKENPGKKTKAAGFGDRVGGPVRAYAGLEALIGVAGVALVYVLPALGPWLAGLAPPRRGARCTGRPQRA